MQSGPSVSKNKFQLQPHSPNTAVGEIPVQEAPRRRALYAALRYIHELWSVENIERFPAKLQVLFSAIANVLNTLMSQLLMPLV